MLHFRKLVLSIISIGVLLSLSSCFGYKTVAKRTFDAEELAWNATRDMAKAYKKAKAANQWVHFTGVHDYFRTGDHVRWRNDFEISTKISSEETCANQADRLLLSDWEMHWEQDSMCRAVVVARPVLGKTVPFKAKVKGSVVADTVLYFPQLLVLDFGDSITLRDSLLWKKSLQKKAMVLLTFDRGNDVKEFIVKDNGYFKINKRMMKWLEGSRSVKINIYRARSYSIIRNDSENCTIGFFYLERASTEVDVSKMNE